MTLPGMRISAKAINTQATSKGTATNMNAVMSPLPETGFTIAVAVMT
jgi:hypothetical protein